MQVKIYVPKTVEIPSEYLTGLAQRAFDSLGGGKRDVTATRGQLVRQAVADGLLRELDSLTTADGHVDIYSDPSAEAALEIDGKPVTLKQLLDALHSQRSGGAARSDEIEQFRGKTLHIDAHRKAA